MTRIEQIISGLQSIVNDYASVAIFWHVLFYCLVAALLLKWEPSNKIFGILLCLPLISVSLFAWMTGNPFNGSLFAIAAGLILVFGLNAPDSRVETSQLIFLLSGIIMVSFGLIYPHFIKPDSFFGYLYSSPAGLIPCPTISVLIGFALIFNGFGSQSISLLLIIFGLFYGIFGVLKLKVFIDLFLLFGSIMYLAKYILAMRSSAAR